jgi:hypothetical protein
MRVGEVYTYVSEIRSVFDIGAAESAVTYISMVCAGSHGTLSRRLYQNVP